MIMEYLSNPYVYTSMGVIVSTVLYYNRYTIISNTIDRYVDIKWYLGLNKEVTTDKKKLDCKIIKSTKDYIIYTVDDKKYISLDTGLKFEETHDWDKGNINKIIVKYTDGIHKECPSVIEVIHCLSGYKADFHRSTLSLSEIKKIMDAPELDGISKIVVVNDFMEEFIII